jgi:hypothetical protein
MSEQATRDRARDAIEFQVGNVVLTDAILDALDAAGIGLYDTTTDEYTRFIAQLKADNALLRAFVEAWDNWFGERGGINPALDKLKVLTDARRALLDAAGEPGR